MDMTLPPQPSNEDGQVMVQPQHTNEDVPLTVQLTAGLKSEKTKVLNEAAAARYRLPIVVDSIPSDQSTGSAPSKRRPNLITGLHGVKVLYGRFQSSIDFDGQRHTLGTWDDPMEAAKGYAAAAYMIVHLGVRAVSAILTEEEQACLKRMSHEDFITILKFPGAWKQWQRWEDLMPRWRAHYENLARKHGDIDTVRIGRKKRKSQTDSTPAVGKFTAAAALNGVQTPLLVFDPAMHGVEGVVEQQQGGGEGVVMGGGMGMQEGLEHGMAGGEGGEETGSSIEGGQVSRKRSRVHM